MNYRKPEVVILGEAAHAIDFILAKGVNFLADLFLIGMHPAYDLDE